MRRASRLEIRIPLAVGLVAAAAASIMAVEITLPQETARLDASPLPGYELATTHCYTCHSTDYMRYQPSMTRAAWKASVLKMQKTFGAQIPEAAVDPIAEYLAKTYGAERSESRRPQRSGAAAPTSPDAAKKRK
jgi:hypothetical protein